MESAHSRLCGFDFVLVKINASALPSSLTFARGVRRLYAAGIDDSAPDRRKSVELRALRQSPGRPRNGSCDIDVDAPTSEYPCYLTRVG